MDSCRGEARTTLRQLEAHWGELCTHMTEAQLDELVITLDTGWQRVEAATSREAKEQELAAITARLEAMSKGAWALARVIHPPRLRGFTKGIGGADSESPDKAEEECGLDPPRSLTNLVLAFEELTGSPMPSDTRQDNPQQSQTRS